MNLDELKKENINLSKKLIIAKVWMEKEIRAQIKQIAKEKVAQGTGKTKTIFFTENIEEIIINKISNFFGDIMILNITAGVIENIVIAEVAYFHLKENSKSDGLSVIISYHKSLDILIENLITKGFRKYIIKKGNIYLRKNDSLEKTLNSVVNKGYILSVGRLFHLIKLIKENGELYDFGKQFKEYLIKYDYISEILLNDNFYKNFELLIKSDILGKKRHVGKINYNETKSARNLLIGNFKNTDSIIYKIIEIGKVDF